MRYRRSAWHWKLLAWLLAAVCLFMGFISGFITVYCLGNQYYGRERVYQTTQICSELVQREMYDIIEWFWSEPGEAGWKRHMQDTDLRFIVVNEATGEVVDSYVEGLGISVPENMAGNNYLFEANYTMSLGVPGTPLESVYVMDWYFGLDAEGWAWSSMDSNSNYEALGWGVPGAVDSGVETPMQEGVAAVKPDTKAVSYQLLCLLPKNLYDHGVYDGIWQGYELYREMVWWSGSAPWIFALCALGLLVSVVFLCMQSGRRPEREFVCGTWLEQIPLELHLFVDFWAVLGIWWLLTLGYDLQTNPYLTVTEWYLAFFLCAAGAMVCALVLVELLVTLTLRAKLGRFLEGSLVFRILRWLWRGFGRLLHGTGAVILLGFRSIGMVPRAALTVLGVFALEAVLLLWVVTARHWLPLTLAVLLVFNVFLLLAVFWAVGQMKLLRRAAQALAEGDLEYQADTAHMYWDFQQHGEDLNAIADGMQKAVERQMKSERLKTELITNVSHDIKTPLTSIVNYVDLLQKPHTEAERIQYLEVLDRQAKRLKKLTENLVEASKASTGNMVVNLEPTSVMELINQAVEEYRDRLEAGKLEVVVSQRADLDIMADGKLMWRILDNLLNNVIKYALPGTRVYVAAQKDGGQVVIAVKNISRDPLNMDADELMERFVRGDSSRHTEGTGLGLNIARSLTQLQHGEFSLTVDGDFFKAEIRMPAA